MGKHRFLIVEDEFLSRQLLQICVDEFASYDIAVDGKEAVQAVKRSYETGCPYDVIFLDIILPQIDGLSALKEIRAYEASRGIVGKQTTKVVMTTALSDAKNVMESFSNQCEAYITKPYSKEKILKVISEL